MGEKDLNPKEKLKESEEITIPLKEFQELQKKVENVEAVREQLLRSAADFDNAKKRLMRERDEFVKYSQEALIRDLLPVLDNFSRALGHVREDIANEGLKNVLAGIQMIYKQVNEILKTQGLKRLETIGQKFDPHRHEAVGHVVEKGPEDVIVDEIEAGYFLHDKLLRAAKVRIRVSPSSQSQSSQSDEKQEEIT